MKIKYIKVNTVDRLPEETGFYYIVKSPECFDQKQIGTFTLESMEFKQENVTHWLEPVPDREEEMMEMLESILSDLNEDPEDFPTSFWQMKLNNYLTN